MFCCSRLKHGLAAGGLTSGQSDHHSLVASKRGEGAGEWPRNSLRKCAPGPNDLRGWHSFGMEGKKMRWRAHPVCCSCSRALRSRLQLKQNPVKHTSHCSSESSACQALLLANIAAVVLRPVVSSWAQICFLCC